MYVCIDKLSAAPVIRCLSCHHSAVFDLLYVCVRACPCACVCVCVCVCIIVCLMQYIRFPMIEGKDLAETVEATGT
jgi:hypothetical protein